MKHSIFQINSFLLFTLLIVGFSQQSKAQCTAFLGPDKFFMPCSNPVVLNFNTIFNQPLTTTFQQTALAPFDTLFGTGGAPDTLKPLTSKTLLTATRADGCTDVAIVSLGIRVWPIPNLGNDTTVNMGFQEEFMNISSGFTNKATFISGYNSHSWSTATPQNVDTGKYSLTVVTHDGCSDVLNITVACAKKGDTLIKKCNEVKYNLTTLFVKSGYSNTWKTLRKTEGDTILTANPTAVDTGRYMLLSSKPGRCTDTMMVKIDSLPRLNMGPDRRLVKCFGVGIDLTREFNLFSLTTQWTVGDATKAPIGDHRLIATTPEGCKDTVFINVRDTAKPYIGPDENERICPTGTFINLTNNFIINDLIAEWNTPDPTHVNDAGNYRVIASNGFGCKDTAFFTIEHFDRPTFLNDTIVKICGGKVKDLNTIFNLGEDYALVDWSTTNTTQAGAGDYTVTIRNTFTECDFTANVTVEVLNSVAPNLNLCLFNMGSTSVFTTNYFRTAIIDKRGHVWAGTEDGGLYRFSPLPGTACGGVWQKNIPFSGIKATINRYKDLQLSNIIGDTSIWAASQGYDHPRDITGGIDHVLDLNAPLEHFGSVNVPASTDLGSRNVNSITIGNSGKIYAALGQSLTYDTTVSSILEGGIYHNSLINTLPSFTQFLPNLPLSDVRVTATGKRGANKIWFAVDKSCDPLSGGCITPYISEINDPSMLVTNTYNETNSVIPFDMPNLLVRAIFTASDGRTYVGLNNGVGIAVLEEDDGATTPNWTLVNQSNSPILPNTSVNFNAITEVNGEIWIGTTQGLLVYDGVGPLSECASYTLYTTAQNLPSNNVTDIAYDEKTFSVWLTTANGICKILQNHAITGNIYNASCGSYTSLSSTIKKTPLKEVVVHLYEVSQGVPDKLLATKITDVTGSFEFANLLPSKKYTVEVSYKNNEYYYAYDNLSSTSLIGDIIIPDSLKTEMKELMDTVSLYELKMDLYGYSKVVMNANGFDTSTYKSPFDYYANNVIEDKHNERVENIANYYMAIATIYSMAINRTDLRAEEYATVMDGIQSIAAFFEFGSEFNRKNLKLMTPVDETSTLLRAICKDLIIAIKVLFKANVETIQDPDIKKDFKDNVLPNINAALDLLGNFINNGAIGTGLNEIVELIKKIILVGATKKSHEWFCTEFHNGLIQNLSLQSKDLYSKKKYSSVYPIVYSRSDPVPPALPSFNLQQITIHDSYKDEISLLKDGAKFADAAAGTFDAIADVKVGLISKAMKVFAYVSKSLNTGMLFRAAYKGLQGANEIDKLSQYVPRQTGFNGSLGFSVQTSPFKNLTTNVVLDSLRSKRTIYNQRITELKPFYNQSFDSASYYAKVKEFLFADSIFKAEIESVNYLLQPKISEAVRSVNNFLPRFEMAMDSVTNALIIDGNYFAIENLSYMIDPDSAELKTSLFNSVDQLKIRSNTLVDLYEEIFSMTSDLTSPAYLVNTNYTLNFSNQPNSNGSVTYTLKNLGNTTQSNVSALMEQPEGGFLVTSPTFVNLGDFAPGQSKQLTYSFTSPASDTIGNYTIKMFADNGTYNNIKGILVSQLATDNTAPVSIKAGNWNDPTVWSTGLVPTAVSAVIVRHNVVVNVDATCKTLKAESPAQVQVATGKKLTILQ